MNNNDEKNLIQNKADAAVDTQDLFKFQTCCKIPTMNQIDNQDKVDDSSSKGFCENVDQFKNNKDLCKNVPCCLDNWKRSSYDAGKHPEVKDFCEDAGKINFNRELCKKNPCCLDNFKLQSSNEAVKNPEVKNLCEDASKYNFNRDLCKKVPCCLDNLKQPADDIVKNPSTNDSKFQFHRDICTKNSCCLENLKQSSNGAVSDLLQNIAKIKSHKGFCKNFPCCVDTLKLALMDASNCHGVENLSQDATKIKMHRNICKKIHCCLNNLRLSLIDVEAPEIKEFLKVNSVQQSKQCDGCPNTERFAAKQSKSSISFLFPLQELCKCFNQIMDTDTATKKPDHVEFRNFLDCFEEQKTVCSVQFQTHLDDLVGEKNAKTKIDQTSDPMPKVACLKVSCDEKKKTVPETCSENKEPKRSTICKESPSPNKTPQQESGEVCKLMPCCLLKNEMVTKLSSSDLSKCIKHALSIVDRTKSSLTKLGSNSCDRLCSCNSDSKVPKLDDTRTMFGELSHFYCSVGQLVKNIQDKSHEVRRNLECDLKRLESAIKSLIDDRVSSATGLHNFYEKLANSVKPEESKHKSDFYCPSCMKTVMNKNITISDVHLDTVNHADKSTQTEAKSPTKESFDEDARKSSSVHSRSKDNDTDATCKNNTSSDNKKT